MYDRTLYLCGMKLLEEHPMNGPKKKTASLYCTMHAPYSEEYYMTLGDPCVHNGEIVPDSQYGHATSL